MSKEVEDSGAREIPVGLTDLRHSLEPTITDPSAFHADRVNLMLGDLTVSGFASQDAGCVANFRNIQYARIAGRWHEAQILDPTLQKGIVDATQWGPRAPQGLNVAHRDTTHLYPRTSLFDRQSEFECLNLNVYAPSHVLDGKGRGLPVLVWIHGGSFDFGDGGCEFDGQYLVKRSLDLGQPVIVVGINYRLGALGFLSSRELRQEARARGEVGYSNLGFADQRVALQWVSKYISHFGGDGSRITAAGESAGAISVLAHVRGNMPVCRNALIMSAGSVVPMPQHVTQVTFDSIVEKLGLAGEATDEAKLAAMRSVPADKLQQLAADRTEIILTEDPEFFADYSGERFEVLAEMPSLLERLVVGDLKEENAPMAHHWRMLSPDTLVDMWKGLYGNDDAFASKVLEAYGVKNWGSSGASQPDVPEALVAYTSDALFSFATKSIARSRKAHSSNQSPKKTKVYEYRFDQPDMTAPSQAHRDRVYHSMDNAFLFCHPPVAGSGAPQEFVSTSADFSGAAIRLMYGEDPWEEVNLSGRFRIFRGDSGRMADSDESLSSRWEGLADTQERRDKFLLGKDLIWKTVALIMQGGAR